MRQVKKAIMVQGQSNTPSTYDLFRRDGEEGHCIHARLSAEHSVAAVVSSILVFHSFVTKLDFIFLLLLLQISDFFHK